MTAAFNESATAYDRNFFADGGLYYQHKFNNKGHNLSVSVNGMGWGSANGGDVKREYTLPTTYTHQMRQENTDSHTGVWKGKLSIIVLIPKTERSPWDLTQAIPLTDSI